MFTEENEPIFILNRQVTINTDVSRHWVSLSDRVKHKASIVCALSSLYLVLTHTAYKEYSILQYVIFLSVPSSSQHHGGALKLELPPPSLAGA